MLRSLFSFNQKNRDKWVIEQLHSFKKGKKILDVGAGSCPYKENCSQLQYFTHDFKQLSSEQLLFGSGYGKIDFVSDIISIPVENESFDYILCTEVLEHVPKPIDAIVEMVRILKIGGTMIITAPLGSHIHQDPYHFYGGYTPFFYKEVFSSLGEFDLTITQNKGLFSFYAQESVRVCKQLLAIKFFPINILLLMFFIPTTLVSVILRNFLDKFYPNENFTVGYHVKVKKIK